MFAPYIMLRCNMRSEAMGIAFFHFVCLSLRNWNGTFRHTATPNNTNQTHSNSSQCIHHDRLWQINLKMKRNRGKQKKNNHAQVFLFLGNFWNAFFLLQTNIFLFLFVETERKKHRRIFSSYVASLLFVLWIVWFIVLLCAVRYPLYLCAHFQLVSVSFAYFTRFFILFVGIGLFILPTQSHGGFRLINLCKNSECIKTKISRFYLPATNAKDMIGQVSFHLKYI